jgi:integrase
VTARPNGEGSVYRRKDGRWAAAAYVVTAGGVRRRKTVYGRTRAEVFEKLGTMQAHSRKGLPAVQGEPTLKDFLEAWVRDVLPGTVREKPCSTTG